MDGLAVACGEGAELRVVVGAPFDVVLCDGTLARLGLDGEGTGASTYCAIFGDVPDEERRQLEQRKRHHGCEWCRRTTTRRRPADGAGGCARLRREPLSPSAGGWRVEGKDRERRAAERKEDAPVGVFSSTVFQSHRSEYFSNFPVTVELQSWDVGNGTGRQRRKVRESGMTLPVEPALRSASDRT